MNRYRGIALRKLSQLLSSLPLNWPPSELRPCFVIGNERSGTKVLCSLLEHHPELGVMWGEANDIWHPHSYPWHRSFEYDGPPYWQDPEAFTRWSLQRRGVRPLAKVRRAFEIYQFLTRRRVFVNKTVMANFMVEEIAAEFPNAYFIHIARDGMSVALSATKKELAKVRTLPRYPEKLAGLDEPAMLRLQGRLWSGTLCSLGRARAGRERWLEIRYEDLCQDPQALLDRIFAFLGVAPCVLPAQAVQGIESRNTKAGRELPADVREELARIIAPGAAFAPPVQLAAASSREQPI